jgi:hypothetical protein
MQSAGSGSVRFSRASQSLLSTCGLHAWHEADSDVLHLEWRGRVTRSLAQMASIQVAQLAIARRYPRILICTNHVQAVGNEVAGWLASRLLPGLCLLGAHHLAWVCAPSRDNVALAHSLSVGLTLPTRLFADTASAEAWLRSSPDTPVAHPYSATEARRVRRTVGAWQWQVLTALARHPFWPLIREAGGQ